MELLIGHIHQNLQMVVQLKISYLKKENAKNLNNLYVRKFFIS